jgi:hypothetical protein
MRDCRTKGETPLHRAAAFGNEEDIITLLDSGVRIDVLDANGDSPLSWASWYLRPGAVLALLCYGHFASIRTVGKRLLASLRRFHGERSVRPSAFIKRQRSLYRFLFHCLLNAQAAAASK